MTRRLASLHDGAASVGVHQRTLRTYAAKGYVTLYKVAGVRGALVDLDELARAVRLIPTYPNRPDKPRYGRKARVVVLAQNVTPGESE